MTQEDKAEVQGLVADVEEVQDIVRNVVLPHYHAFWRQLWFGWFIPLS